MNNFSSNTPWKLSIFFKSDPIGSNDKDIDKKMAFSEMENGFL